MLQVEFKSACNKLDKNTIHIDEDIPTQNSKKKISAYRARKLHAIAITSQLLVKWNKNKNWSSLFHKSSMKEKDDLSDCLLQALTTYQTQDATIEKETIKTEKKKKKAAKKKEEVVI